MALIVHYHTAVPAPKERPVVKPGKTKDCGCGGKDKAKDAPDYSTRAERGAELAAICKSAGMRQVGNSEFEKATKARGIASVSFIGEDYTFTFAGTEKHGTGASSLRSALSQMTKDSTSDAAYAQKLTRDAGEPVNAAWLKLDRMTPDSLAREARSKGIKDETKTGQVMGILRAQFKPNQIEAWSQHF